MKINPIELQKIIKEEATRLKKRMMLEAEKTAIVKQLQEMEELDEEIQEEGLMDLARQTFGGASSEDEKAASASFDAANAQLGNTQSANKQGYLAKAKSYAYKGKFIVTKDSKGRPMIAWEGQASMPATGGRGVGGAKV